MCVNWQAEREELVDETRKLCDIRPCHYILRVVERKGGKAEKLLNAQIGFLIGKGIVDCFFSSHTLCVLVNVMFYRNYLGLHEFDALKNSEVNEFRWRMRAVCEDIAKTREDADWISKAMYKYPVRLAGSPEIPETLKLKLKNDCLVIMVRFEEVCFT